MTIMMKFFSFRPGGRGNFGLAFFCVFLADNSLIPKGKRRRNEIGKYICGLYLPTYILSFLLLSYLTSIFLVMRLV